MTNILNSQPKKASILIVDDIPSNLELLSRAILDAGYEPRPIPSGRLALTAAHVDPPDLILLDIRMPVMDGFEVCRQFKATENLKDIPIIFITALSDTDEKIKAFAVGAVDYVTKPFHIEEVLARIHLHMQLRQLQRELADHNALLESKINERTHQLREANERLAVLDQAKSDFLKTISHELRTPLHGLFGMASLLFANLPSTEENQSYVNLYHKAEQRILTLVEDAMLLNQIKVTASHYTSDVCFIDKVLKTALEKTRKFSDAKKVTVEYTPPTSLTVIGNNELMARALHSLLATAIKFSKQETSVGLAVCSESDGVRLTIEASGYSIPQVDLPKFFDLLAIAKTLVPEGDLGLAPAVAECVIRAFGGTVSVENIQSSGIRFVVKLQKCKS